MCVERVLIRKARQNANFPDQNQTKILTDQTKTNDKANFVVRNGRFRSTKQNKTKVHFLVRNELPAYWFYVCM